MRPEIALARTAAKGGRYEPWTPSSGTVSFTSQDAAAALAGMRTLGARFVLAKYGSGTERDLRDVAIELGFELASLVEAPKNSRVAGISVMQAVVEEVLSPGTCPRCDGRAYLRDKTGKLYVCSQCEGTGRGSWSANRRARECGMDPRELKTAWGRIYEEARRRLISEELAALDHIARKLRGGGRRG